MTLQAHNVLVVESDLKALRLYQKAFLLRGYDVFAVTSIDEAYLLLGDRDFAVMLVDMESGGAQGIDFLCSVHNQLQAAGTTVIAIYGPDDARSECETLDSLYMLPKQGSVFALGSLIDRLIDTESPVVREDDPTQPSRSAFLRAADSQHLTRG
ncbi:MAG: hypothetical protein U0670_08990 [Anaerolineae bacterium]